jgi:hypothetical protein
VVAVEFAPIFLTSFGDSPLVAFGARAVAAAAAMRRGCFGLRGYLRFWLQLDMLIGRQPGIEVVIAMRVD